MKRPIPNQPPPPPRTKPSTVYQRSEVLSSLGARLGTRARRDELARRARKKLSGCDVALGSLRSVLLEALRQLARLVLTAKELEDLVDEDDGEGEGEREHPVVPRERHNREDGGEGGHVQDDEVEAEGDGHREEEVRVGPRRHLEERAVLRERVERVEHLDGDEHRERERRGRVLAVAREVAAAALLARADVGAAVGDPRRKVGRVLVVGEERGEVGALAPVERCWYEISGWPYSDQS